MKHNPLVSIIINNYNYSQYLSFCIDSALKQTYKCVEIVVVDDGSTDNSVELIKSYRDKVVGVFKFNEGQASAFNSGFENSTGDIVCFLDSDDVFVPQKIAKIVEIFQSDKEIEWCFHSLEYIDCIGCKNSIQPKEFFSSRWDLRRQVSEGQPIPYIPTATSGMCFKRDLLEQILPMPQEIKITSDNYLKFVAVALGKGYFENLFLAHQRIHDSNAYTLRKDKYQQKSDVLISTAYSMRNRFPVLEKYSDGLFVLGLGIFLRLGRPQQNTLNVIFKYFKMIGFFAKTSIALRTISCFLKNPEGISLGGLRYES